MVLRMIELGYPLNEVIFCDTSAEFPDMYNHIERVTKEVVAAGIKFTTLQAEHDFEYYLLHYKPARRNPEKAHLSGMSWPTARVRWCTGMIKLCVIEKYLRKLKDQYDVQQYVGIAADEGDRLQRKNNQASNHHHPLVEWGWAEADAMRYCREKGYDWGGLYDRFDRVSCWCCPLKSLDELRKLKVHYPELWTKLHELDRDTWSPFKWEYRVTDLDKRFELEEALAVIGESIKNRKFFFDLRRCLQDGVGIEEIVTERISANKNQTR